MMPNTYVRWYRRAWHTAYYATTRYGIKAGIVALGAVLAARSLDKTTYLAATPLVQRVAESAPVHTVGSDILRRTPSNRIAPGGLDAGLEHERITYWVDKLSTSFSGGFQRSLSRMSQYAEMITAKLDAKQAPRDLIYLALIESNFDPKARSPAKAVGMWQFMTATARRFGLTVHGKVDERKNPERSTDAAISYLSQLHDRFGSWYLAAAAYNSGEGTVLRALKRVTGRKTGTDEDFFRILPVLPRETQDYVPKLIAAARVGSAPRKDRLATARSVADGQ
jgi:hypothetical protein